MKIGKAIGLSVLGFLVATTAIETAHGSMNADDSEPMHLVVCWGTNPQTGDNIHFACDFGTDCCIIQYANPDGSVHFSTNCCAEGTVCDWVKAPGQEIEAVCHDLN